MYNREQWLGCGHTENLILNVVDLDVELNGRPLQVLPSEQIKLVLMYSRFRDKCPPQAQVFWYQIEESRK